METDQDKEKIVFGCIGLCHPLYLQQIKDTIENIPHFKLVFMKTSQGKLYIVGEKEDL